MHVGAEAVRLRRIVPPDPVFERLAAHDARARAHELPENPLPRRVDAKKDPVTRDGARRKVEFQRADPDGMGAAAVGAPQKRLDAAESSRSEKGFTR